MQRHLHDSAQLYICSDHLGLIAFFFQSGNDLILMLGTECFQCDTQFHGSAAVDGYELVVLQLDNIALLLGDDACHTYQFTRTVRKKDLSGSNTDTVKIRSLKIRPCCTTEDMVMTSILPPLRIDTIRLSFTFNCFKAATVSRPEFSTIIL